jgi:hypothetical protein
MFPSLFRQKADASGKYPVNSNRLPRQIKREFTAISPVRQRARPTT